MELKVEVCTRERCKVYVKDITPTSSSEGYLPEDSKSYMKDRFKYSETASIEAIYLIRFEALKNKTKEVVHVSHSEFTKDDMFKIPIKFDGVFNVVHIVLPTKQWFMDTFNNNPGFLEVYDVIYYVDGTSMYKAVKERNEGSLNDWTFIQVDIDELIERNTEGSTISRVCETYVSVCYLTYCYISLCKRIFDGDGFSRCSTRDKTDRELSYKRDLVWMTLNVIRYMVEFGDLQEAQRLIETIGGCNGLCECWYEHYNKSANCGCGCG